jgi:WD40 repeat protein
MKGKKRPWSNAEKALFLAPLLILLAPLVLSISGLIARRLTGKPTVLTTTSNLEIWEMTVSRDGSVVAASDTDRKFLKNLNLRSGVVYLWNARTLRPLPPFPVKQWTAADGSRHGNSVDGISLSPDGQIIGMSGRNSPHFTVYEISSQKVLWQQPVLAATSIFTADGRFIALGNYKVGFEMREARSGKLVYRWNAPNGGMKENFSLSPDEKTVAWIGAQQGLDGFQSQRIEIRRTSDGKVLRILDYSDQSETVAFSPDGKLIISVTRRDSRTGNNWGSLIRCHSISGKLLWEKDYTINNPQRVRFDMFCDAIFSPDGQRIAVRNWNLPNSADHALILDINGQEIQQLKSPKGQHTFYPTSSAIAFSPDGKRVFGRGHNSILVWDLR